MKQHSLMSCRNLEKYRVSTLLQPFPPLKQYFSSLNYFYMPRPCHALHFLTRNSGNSKTTDQRPLAGAQAYPARLVPDRQKEHRTNWTDEHLSYDQLLNVEAAYATLCFSVFFLSSSIKIFLPKRFYQNLSYATCFENYSLLFAPKLQFQEVHFQQQPTQLLVGAGLLASFLNDIMNVLARYCGRIFFYFCLLLKLLLNFFF